MFKELVLHRAFRGKGPVFEVTPDQAQAHKRFLKKCEQGYYQFEKAPCVCGNSKGTLVGKRDRYDLPVDTWLCDSCAMLWSSPRLTASSMIKFYDEDYRSMYGEESATEDFLNVQINRGGKVLKYVAAHLGSVESKTVFDIGCGAGGLLIPFREAGAKVYGCDLGSRYLDEGRRQGLTLEHGNQESLAKYGPADLVIVNHVLEHCTDPLAELKNLSGKIAKDGFLFIEVPGVLWIHQGYNDLMRFLQNAHIYHFHLHSLATLLAKAGFKLVQGDEICRGLFQKAAEGEKITVDVPAPSKRHVLNYLYFTEVYRALNIRSAKSVAKKVLSKLRAK